MHSGWQHRAIDEDGTEFDDIATVVVPKNSMTKARRVDGDKPVVAEIDEKHQYSDPNKTDP